MKKIKIKVSDFLNAEIVAQQIKEKEVFPAMLIKDVKASKLKRGVILITLNNAFNFIDFSNAFLNGTTTRLLVAESEYKIEYLHVK